MSNRNFGRSTLLAACLLSLLGTNTAQAAPTEEWASSVFDFSSEFRNPRWAAFQALGAPNTPYGDIDTAWSPAPLDGTVEYITVGFDTATYSTGALVRETYNSGFVTRIDARDSSGNLHQVWSGIDTSTPAAVDFNVTWNQTSFLTTGLKVYVNTNHVLGDWEEIDAIKLYGDTVSAVPEPETYAMLLAGLGALGFIGKRRRAS